MVFDAIEAVASAGEAGTSMVGTTADMLSQQGNNRNAVIEITNMLDENLRGGQHFLEWGNNSIPPQPTIRPHTREACKFDKVPDTATGCSGVMAYTVEGTKQKRFAIIFSVPYNYIHSENWFGLRWINNGVSVDSALYNDMYSDSDWNKIPDHSSASSKYQYAKNGQPVSIATNDYVVSATMSNVGRSIIKLEISPKK